MKKILLSVLLVIFVCSNSVVVFAQDNDTVPTYLQELVVESKNSWVEKDRVVFVPTKKEKNLANSVETLITSMNIPLIKINDDKMMDLRGEDVTVFINGAEATQVELSNFWPKDALRVEYLANPSDPKYKGCRAVINIITPVYAAGGVTKVETTQLVWPYFAFYNVSSKLVYKKMTYGAMINAINRNGNVTEEEKEEYYNIWYNDQQYPILSNERKGESKSHGDNIKAAFNAIYNKDNMRMVHVASLSWDKWNSLSDFANRWTPEIFNSEYSRSDSRNRTISPGVSGMYEFVLSSKFQLNASWQYSYASINKENNNQMADLAVIANNSCEKAHATVVRANLYYILSPKSYLQLSLDEKVNVYSIRYSGSYDNLSRQTAGTSTTGITWGWSPSNRFSINVTPGITVNYRRIRGVDNEVDVNPFFYLSSNWYQSDRAYLNITGMYQASNASASQANEVLQRQSELLWFKGNPEIGNYIYGSFGIQQIWMPVSWLTPSLNVKYTYWKIPYRNFSVAPQEMGGLIEQPYNDRPMNEGYIGLNLNSNLFNRKLGINITPSVRFIKYCNGDEAKTLNRFAIDGRVNYTFGNFRINVSYTGVEKSIFDGGYVIQYRPDKWGLEITYGNGDFYAGIKISDIFHKYYRQRHDSFYDNYISYSMESQRGRKFTLDLSYTFGYGKRVNKSVHVQTADGVASGAAGS